MEKDIKVLLSAKDRKTFDEQAAMWPGVNNFAQYSHNCVCTDPDCLMHCVQSIGRWFASPDIFEEFLSDLAEAKCDMDVKTTMAMYADRDPHFARSLDAAYDAQQRERNGVSQRAVRDNRTVH